MPHSILVVDDEKNIVKGIKFGLEQDGMRVDAAYDGEEALVLAHSQAYDLIILDLMLPKMNGEEVCQQIREFSNVPIIMLTAKGEDIDKIMGFEYGADDYMTKPYNLLELKMRIKTILRRSQIARTVVAPPPVKLTLRDLSLDTQSRRVFVGDMEINLTAKEYDLLETFMKNVGKIYYRDQLMAQIWGQNDPNKDNRTVDVHIRRLREKIEENPYDPKFIHTKWGVGYYIR